MTVGIISILFGFCWLKNWSIEYEKHCSILGQSEHPTPTPTSNTVTLSGTAIDAPIIGGDVVINNLDGLLIAKTKTDNSGSYNIEVSESDIINGFKVTVTNGTMLGNAFEDELQAIYSSAQRTDANTTPLTTLISKLTENDDGQGEPLVKRDAIINKLVNIGMISKNDWFELEPASFDISELQKYVHTIGLNVWVEKIAQDLNDGDLADMRGFPDAHGGVIQAIVQDSDNSRLLGNIGEKLTSKVEVYGKEGVTYKFSAVTVPDGFTVSDDGLISYIVPPSINPRTDIEFTLKVVNSSTNKGRTITGSVYILPVTVIGSKQVFPGIGVVQLSDSSHDTVVKIPRESISDATTIEITKDKDDQGNPTSSIYIDKEVNGEIEIILPDPDIVETEELIEPQSQKKLPFQNKLASLTDVDPYPMVHNFSTPNKSYFYKVNCGLGKGNRVDSKVLKIKLGGNCRVPIGSPLIRSTLKTSSQLLSECDDFEETCYKNKEPVIFVHGYLPSTGFLGIGGLGGGEGTWGYFPQAIKTLNSDIRVFEFQWVTAARFEDVAADLGTAINLIARKTGKKVHIIAHSFGGVLTRTYLQNLATDFNFKNDVASLTTVGSPHSGIFDEDKIAHGIAFKQGQDSQHVLGRGIDGNHQINLCAQITCYQMGEYVGFNQTELNIYKIDLPDQADGSLYSVMDVSDNLSISKKPGKFISVLSKMDEYPLPDFLQTQILIGLSTQRGSNDVVDEGDGLISFEGQRFSPDVAASAYLSQSTSYGGNVTEKILGLNIDSKPGDEYSTNNPLFRLRAADGYKHSSYPVGPADAVREVNVSQPCEVKIGSLDCWDSDDHHTFLAAKEWIINNPSEDYDYGTIAIEGTVKDTLGNSIESEIKIKFWKDDEYYPRTLETIKTTELPYEIPFFPNAHYVLVASAENYKSSNVTSLLMSDTQNESSGNFGTIILGSKELSLETLTGSITNAITGQAVTTGVSYSIYKNGNRNNVVRSGVTDIEGNYSESDLPSGNYILEIEEENFISNSKEIHIPLAVGQSGNINIRPALQTGQMSIVLTWAENPRDLDSHLIKYDSNEQEKYHIFYGDRDDSTTGDNLDLDDTSSFGPETITIQSIDSTSHYIYAVRHFSGSGSISSTSNAKVTIDFGSNDTSLLSAPTTGDGRWWKVFEIIQGNIIPCRTDCILDNQPTNQNSLVARKSQNASELLWLNRMEQDVNSAPKK